MASWTSLLPPRLIGEESFEVLVAELLGGRRVSNAGIPIQRRPGAEGNRCDLCARVMRGEFLEGLAPCLGGAINAQQAGQLAAIRRFRVVVKAPVQPAHDEARGV